MSVVPRAEIKVPMKRQVRTCLPLSVGSVGRRPWSTECLSLRACPKSHLGKPERDKIAFGHVPGTGHCSLRAD